MKKNSGSPPSTNASGIFSPRLKYFLPVHVTMLAGTISKLTLLWS
jgi:hypothetical protein